MKHKEHGTKHGEHEGPITAPSQDFSGQPSHSHGEQVGESDVGRYIRREGPSKQHSPPGKK